MELRLLLSAALLVVCVQRGFSKPAPGDLRPKRFLRPGNGAVRAMTLEQLKCECESHSKLFECTCISRKMLDSNSTINSNIVQCLEDFAPPAPERPIDISVNIVAPGRGGEEDSGLDNRATEPPQPQCTLTRKERKAARGVYCLLLQLVDIYVTTALGQLEQDCTCVDYEGETSQLQTPLRLIKAIDKWHDNMMRQHQSCRPFLFGEARRTHLEVTDFSYPSCNNNNAVCTGRERRIATERWDLNLAVIAKAMHMVDEMSELGATRRKIYRGCVSEEQVQCTNILQNQLISTQATVCNTTT